MAASQITTLLLSWIFYRELVVELLHASLVAVIGGAVCRCPVG